MKERKLNNKGFSLVELIIVIAIMVILVVVIAPQYTKFVNNSRVSADVQTAQTIATTVDAAVAEGANPFATAFANVAGINGTLPPSKFTGGSFNVSGNDVDGVQSITLTIAAGNPNAGTYECYPNPDDATDGVNARLKR